MNAYTVECRGSYVSAVFELLKYGTPSKNIFPRLENYTMTTAQVNNGNQITVAGRE